jgi:hypothetical protein
MAQRPIGTTEPRSGGPHEDTDADQYKSEKNRYEREALSECHSA